MRRNGPSDDPTLQWIDNRHRQPIRLSKFFPSVTQFTLVRRRTEISLEMPQMEGPASWLHLRTHAEVES